MTDEHRTSVESISTVVEYVGWRQEVPTDFWYVSCICGWDRDGVPSDQVNSVRQQHEESA